MRLTNCRVSRPHTSHPATPCEPCECERGIVCVAKRKRKRETEDVCVCNLVAASDVIGNDRFHPVAPPSDPSRDRESQVRAPRSQDYSVHRTRSKVNSATERNTSSCKNQIALLSCAEISNSYQDLTPKLLCDAYPVRCRVPGY